MDIIDLSHSTLSRLLAPALGHWALLYPPLSTFSVTIASNNALLCHTALVCTLYLLHYNHVACSVLMIRILGLIEIFRLNHNNILHGRH